MILDTFDQAARNFQYDYIYIDAIFVSIWLVLLIKNKKWNPLLVGVICGILVYIIDAVWWWNTPAGTNYPEGTFIREYWIGGVQMPHPLGEYFLLKFGADFMMTLSYSFFAFAWLWIIFENFEKKDKKEVILYTGYYFIAWMLTPFLSILLPINDTMVNTVRHMDTQMIVWLINVIIGYTILSLIYGTDLLKRKNPRIIVYVFIVGVLESFFMEFPLFITGIRPTGLLFLIYEIFFLFNQGAPYLYILYDIVLPALFTKLNLKKNKLSEET